VETVVLLAGSVSPQYPLDTLAGKVPALYSFYSPVDLIVGIGTSLFGGNDRRWGPGCGAVGFRNPPQFLTQRAWRLADMRQGYLGDHFTIASPQFVAQQIAPLLTCRPETRIPTQGMQSSASGNCANRPLA